MLLTPIRPGARVRLRDRDALPPRGILSTEHDLDHEQEKLLGQLEELQNALYAEHQRALLAVVQARDAGGKDGTIRRVFGSLNPQGCVVTRFKRPTDAELAHDYLWRAHLAVPPKGMIGIFNRSHYEDALGNCSTPYVPGTWCPATWHWRRRSCEASPPRSRRYSSPPPPLPPA
jgi:polyphosphate kinase 2 (PPK2 family)